MVFKLKPSIESLNNLGANNSTESQMLNTVNFALSPTKSTLKNLVTDQGLGKTNQTLGKTSMRYGRTDNYLNKSVDLMQTSSSAMMKTLQVGKLNDESKKSLRNSMQT